MSSLLLSNSIPDRDPIVGVSSSGLSVGRSTTSTYWSVSDPNWGRLGWMGFSGRGALGAGGGGGRGGDGDTREEGGGEGGGEGDAMRGA